MDLYEKELRDYELYIKSKYPEAHFVDGIILDAKVTEEEREYYEKVYNDWLNNRNVRENN